MIEPRNALLTFIRDELLEGRSSSGIEEDTELLQSGIVDSLGIMRLVNFITEEFGYNVPAEDITIENFSSVSVIAAYLGTRLGKLESCGGAADDRR
jgi:acyl carrier protein